MALTDITREVLIEFRADTSEAKAQIKELEGAEKELAETQLEQAQARNEQIDQWLEKLGKVALAIGVVMEAGELALDGYKESIKEARLETAAHGVDLEKLSEAAHGLKTEMELLEFAAKANNTAWKNSQEDMENAQKAIYTLEARGVDAEKATKAVTDAIIGLKTKGLQELGIEIDKHVPKVSMFGDKLDDLTVKENLLAEIHRELARLAEQSGNAHEMAGEKMGQTSKKLADSWADLKKGLGELVVAMQPLLEALATAVGLIAKIVDKVGGSGAIGTVAGAIWDHRYGVLDPLVRSARDTIGRGLSGGGGDQDVTFDTVSHAVLSQYQLSDTNSFASAVDQLKGRFGTGAGMGTSYNSTAAYDAALLANAMNEFGQYAKIDIDQPTWKAPKPGKDTTYTLGGRDGLVDQTANTPEWYGVANADNGLGAAALGSPELSNKLMQADAVKYLHDMTEETKKFEEEQAKLAKLNAEGFASKEEKTFLQKTFGKVSDFDIYKEAFKSLEGGVSSAMKAWLEGSESAGQAFKKFIGTAVESLALQMGVESLKHAAYALGSLAFGDAAGAAKHALAAAEFGAGAIAAALVAKELGVGAKTPATAKGASGSGGGNSQQSGHSGGPQGPVIVIGDSFAQDSPRMRQQNAQNLVALGLGMMYGVQQG